MTTLNSTYQNTLALLCTQSLDFWLYSLVPNHTLSHITLTHKSFISHSVTSTYDSLSSVTLHLDLTKLNILSCFGWFLTIVWSISLFQCFALSSDCYLLISWTLPVFHLWCCLKFWIRLPFSSLKPLKLHVHPFQISLTDSSVIDFGFWSRFALAFFGRHAF